jgi:hypothetical protein
MRITISVAATLALLFGFGTARASTVTYNSASSFSAAIGPSITDNYESPGYQNGDIDNSSTLHDFRNAAMDAVFNQTKYTPTEFLNTNGILYNSADNSWVYYPYNGTFTMNYQSTSLTVNNGVYGVGFNYYKYPGSAYTAFVTFGDGSTEDFSIPDSGYSTVLSQYFGITSDLAIESIAIAGSNGQAFYAGNTFFEMDNLTIAASPTPLPAALPLFAGGLGFVGYLTRRRKRSGRQALAAA